MGLFNFNSSMIRTKIYGETIKHPRYTGVENLPDDTETLYNMLQAYTYRKRDDETITEDDIQGMKFKYYISTSSESKHHTLSKFEMGLDILQYAEFAKRAPEELKCHPYYKIAGDADTLEAIGKRFVQETTTTKFKSERPVVVEGLKWIAAAIGAVPEMYFPLMQQMEEGIRSELEKGYYPYWYALYQMFSRGAEAFYQCADSSILARSDKRPAKVCEIIETFSLTPKDFYKIASEKDYAAEYICIAMQGFNHSLYGYLKQNFPATGHFEYLSICEKEIFQNKCLYFGELFEKFCRNPKNRPKPDLEDVQKDVENLLLITKARLGYPDAVAAYENQIKKAQEELEKARQKKTMTTEERAEEKAQAVLDQYRHGKKEKKEYKSRKKKGR